MAKRSTGVGEGISQALFVEGFLDSRTDAQLLERFVAGDRGPGSGAAFAALVGRHGPMVLRACRSVLRDEHDAEDAFQATFLVLARQPRSIRRRDSLASWLHGVALRVAACLRRRAMTRRKEEWETRGESGRFDRPGPDPDPGPIVHEEVGRLPERFRGPVVLCYLEGLTHDAAAERLGVPVGTVRSRLATARNRLRVRMTRRGLAPSAFPIGASLAADRAVAAPLAEATVRLAMGEPVASSASIAPLIEEVLGAMILTRKAILGSTVLALGLAASAALWLGASGLAGVPPQRATPRRSQPAPSLADRRPAPRSPSTGGPRRIGDAQSRREVSGVEDHRGRPRPDRGHGRGP